MLDLMSEAMSRISRAMLTTGGSVTGTGVPQGASKARWLDVYPTLAGSDQPDWFGRVIDPFDGRGRNRCCNEAAKTFIERQRQVPLGDLMPTLIDGQSELVRLLQLEAGMISVLRRNGYRTLADLLSVVIEDLLRVDGVGRSMVERAVAALARRAACVVVEFANSALVDEGADDPLGQVGDPQLAERLSERVRAITTSSTGREVSADEDEAAIRTRAEANVMASEYLDGLSLRELARRCASSPDLVRTSIMAYTDLDIPPLEQSELDWQADLVAPQQRAEERSARLQLNQTRAREMAAALEEGRTLDQIGAQHQITRERVRQIINRYSGEQVPDIIARRKQAQVEAELDRRLRLRADLLAWSERNPGMPVSVAAGLFKCSDADVNQALGERRNLHTTERAVEERWTDAELIDLVRRFHAETGLTSTDDFDGWSRQHEGPSSMTIEIRFGRWTFALQRAGVDGQEPVRHARTYSVRDLWAAVVEYIATPGVRYTFADYERWAKALPGRPSGALLRVRIDRSWVRMRDQASLVLTYPDSLDDVWVADVTMRRDWATFRDGPLTAEQAVRVMGSAVEALGPNLSSAAYQKWARDNKQPTEMTLRRVSGMTWHDLVEAGGGNRPQDKPAPVTDKQIVAALREFLREYPDGGTDQYARWATGVKGRPAMQTIQRRLGGGWVAAKGTVVGRHVGEQ